MAEDKIYWVGLNLVKGIGSVRMRNLLQAFGSAEAAWQAPSHDLAAAGLSPKIITTLVDLRSTVDLEKYWGKLSSLGISVLTWEDDSYPRRLSEISQPPPVLYVRGSLLPEDDWAVAIVGTRRVTSYGRQGAGEIAAKLARKGITVVSGLARGVDACAHSVALQEKGRTIAVLGCGVDRIYPPEHRLLAEQIIENGALISDYAPGTPPDAVNFPPRNRIISGLSKAVVIVEAGKTSGALITAAFAAEQGREVFALPGSIYAPQSQGTNLLIKQGARVYLSSQDLYEVLNLDHTSEQQQARTALPMDPLEARLFGLLVNEPMHIDELSILSELPIEKISSTLIMMELKGMVRQTGSMQYQAVREQLEDYRV